MSKQLSAKIGMFLASFPLILSIFAFLLMNGSTAWFASNKSVSAGGFSVTAKTSPNLVIAKTQEDITSGNMHFEVSFSGVQRMNMIAVTHDFDAETGTYLKYLTNNYAVDNRTGFEKPGATLNFESVPESDNEQYFIDYVVYVASALEELNLSALNATITLPDGTIAKQHMNAASIDFYVGEVSRENYRGTASVADKNQSIDLFASAGGTVPLNTAEPIKIIMRCYFDGALAADDGDAYINSYTVKPDGLAFGVSIVAVE